MQPLIGITTKHDINEHGWRYHAGYAANAYAIIQAGGLPVYLPIGVSKDVLRATFERLDGVLLPGGGDISPAAYRAERHPLTEGVDDDRDFAELALARWAVEEDVPVLGICRGHQLLNVALGGELVQDIATLTEGTLHHDIPFTVPRNQMAHEVNIEPGSQLAQVLGATNIQVNSLHHQAVTRPGEDTRVVAHAPDGMIEAVEIPNHPFALSVQWHPEDLAGENPPAANLFAGLVEAASQRLRTH